MIRPEQILTRAREIMSERGVCQGHVDTDGTCSGILGHTHDAGTCMGTAMDDAYEQLATEHGWTGGLAHRVAEDAVMFVTGSQTPREFNDRQGVSTKDALNAFTAAIAMVAEYFDSVGPARPHPNLPQYRGACPECFRYGGHKAECTSGR